MEGARTVFFFLVHIKETKTEKTKPLSIQINTNLSTFKNQNSLQNYFSMAKFAFKK